MSEPWLGRYGSAEPIQRHGAFRLHAARRAADGGPCVVVAASPIAEPRAAREALARLADAHDAVSHPAVPRTVSIDGAAVGEHDGALFVELASEATIDGATALDRLIDARALLGFGESEALVDLVLGALRAAAEAPGGPRRAGRLSLASLLVSPSGSVHVVGLGHPVTTSDEHGRPATTSALFEAPEVSVGGLPSEGGDVVALLQLRRALVPHLDLPPSLRRVLRGLPADASDEALHALVDALDRREHGTDAERGTLPELAALLGRVRAQLGIEPDPEGLAKVLSDLALGLPIASDWEIAEGADVTVETTVVSASGAWIEVPAQGRQRVELGPSLRRLLALLLARRRQEPERATTTWDLLEAGWPGEKLLPDAGANRVYAAIKRLRNMGLRGVIERHEEGYRILPHASLVEIDD